jgi:hypothetical protein
MLFCQGLTLRIMLVELCYDLSSALCPLLPLNQLNVQGIDYKRVYRPTLFLHLLLLKRLMIMK